MGIRAFVSRKSAAVYHQFSLLLASFYYAWYALLGRTKSAAARAATERKRKAAAKPSPAPRRAQHEEAAAPVPARDARPTAPPAAAGQQRFGCFFLFQLLAALLFWLLVYRLSMAFVAPYFGFRPSLMATTIIEDTGIDMGLIHDMAARIQAVETANRAIGPEIERMLAMEISEAAQRTTDAAVARAIAAAETAAANAASAMLASMPQPEATGEAPAPVVVDEALLRPAVEAAVRKAFDERLEAVLASVRDGEQQLQAELADVRSALDALADEMSRQPEASATPLPHAIGGDSSGLSLADVQNMIASELERYSADQIGLVDYAQASAGGFVYGRHTSPPLSVTSTSLLGWLPLLGDIATVSHLPATVALERNTDVGNCWAFEGRQGHVTIGLSEPIRISNVTIDHIPGSIARHVSSAPRDFALFGYRTEQDIDAGLAVPLGTYTYSTTGPAVQTFAVPELVHTDRSKALYDVMTAVRLEFNSNHGHDFYTCVYRIRVHGSPAFSTKDVVHVGSS